MILTWYIIDHFFVVEGCSENGVVEKKYFSERPFVYNQKGLNFIPSIHYKFVTIYFKKYPRSKSVLDSTTVCILP